jgi:hypothetical protein
VIVGVQRSSRPAAEGMEAVVPLYERAAVMWKELGDEKKAADLHVQMGDLCATVSRLRSWSHKERDQRSSSSREGSR